MCGIVILAVKAGADSEFKELIVSKRH